MYNYIQTNYVHLLWILFGLFGQALFSYRFIIQWLASEKAKQSVIPPSFWLFSIAGSLILSTYAIYRKDPVFIVGQLPSVFIYSRNIYLNKQAKQVDKVYEKVIVKNDYHS